MAPKPPNTAPKAVILHTLGVEVVLTPQIPEAAVPVASCITGTPAPAVAGAAAQLLLLLPIFLPHHDGLDARMGY